MSLCYSTFLLSFFHPLLSLSDVFECFETEYTEVSNIEPRFEYLRIYIIIHAHMYDTTKIYINYHQVKPYLMSYPYIKSRSISQVTILVIRKANLTHSDQHIDMYMTHCPVDRNIAISTTKQENSRFRVREVASIRFEQIQNEL